MSLRNQPVKQGYSAKIVKAALYLTSVACTNSLMGCYQGVADSEELVILQTEHSPRNQVAMLVERFDHSALSGDTFFVLISNNAYPMAVLRKQVYGLHPVFQAGLGGLVLHWSGPTDLEVRCKNCEITPGAVEKQAYSQGEVKIHYVDFPPENRSQ